MIKPWALMQPSSYSLERIISTWIWNGLKFLGIASRFTFDVAWMILILVFTCTVRFAWRHVKNDKVLG